MTALAFVACAALGTLARWASGTRLPRPLGTLSVNILGAFALGWLVSSQWAGQLALGVGGLGAFTTFSAFVDDIHELWQRRWTHSATYIAVTMAAGVGAAWLGLQLG